MSLVLKIGVILLCITISDVRCETCFDCQRVPLPRDCDHVTTCGAHEICHVTQYVSRSGHVFYDSGCIDKIRCNTKRDVNDSSIKYEDEADVTDDVVVCQQCCDGAFCNIQGCGSTPLPPVSERGPICFSCPQGAIKPDHCETLAGCGTDEQCSIEPFVSLGGDNLYRSQCKKCTTLRVELVGKRETCSGCCSTDFCNHNCTLVSSTTPVVTMTSTPTPTTTINIPSTTTTDTNQIDKELECILHGYTYLHIYEACVKPYNDLQLTWYDARAICARDGGDLLILHNKNEEKYFDNWLMNSDVNHTYYWVGASDIQQEGSWKWVDNTPVQSSYFGRNEPNDWGTEDCAVLWYFSTVPHGLLNDAPCSMKNSFICEIQLDGMYEVQTPSKGHCQNPDYTYDPRHGICFKVYDKVNKNWNDARTDCRKNNADLLKLRSSAFEDYFLYLTFHGKNTRDCQEFSGRDKGKRERELVAISCHELEFFTRRFWLGAYRSTYGELQWLNGRKVNLTNFHWAYGQPNNAGNAENCLEFIHLPYGELAQQYALNDNNCMTSAHYICEERCPDLTYSYAPGVDMCYKIHNIPLNWQDAQNVCSSEHAYLTEPRTMDQINFFSAILKTNSADNFWIGARQSSLSSSTFIWQTTNTNVSVDLWHVNEPNNAVDGCASMIQSNDVFRLSDISCSRKSAFICQ